MLRVFGRPAGQFAQDTLGCGGLAGRPAFRNRLLAKEVGPVKAPALCGGAGASQDYGESCVGCSSALGPHSLGKTEVSI
jgi:hypothetical protein